MIYFMFFFSSLRTISTNATYRSVISQATDLILWKRKKSRVECFLDLVEWIVASDGGIGIFFLSRPKTF